MGLMPFGIEQTHGMLLQPGVEFKTSSDGRDWTSLFASQQVEPPIEGTFEARRDQLFVMVKDGPKSVLVIDNRGTQMPIGPGSLFMTCADEDVKLDLELRSTTIETVHVYVRREIIEDVALEMVDGDPARITSSTRYVSSDPVMSSLLETSIAAVQDTTVGSPLFVDFLARAIASQWIRGYSNAPLRVRNGAQTSGRNAKTLAEAIDFLKENIDQSISLDDIGRATNRSASHVSRMFSSELGMPPHQYLMRLRVEKAQKLLVKTSMAIAEIAYECGFSHQEHLSRLFRRFTNTTPAAYRREMRN